MLEAIHAFLGVYWPVVVAIVGTLFLCVPIYVFWEQIRYVLMCTRMRLPLFGTVSQWIKKPGQQDPDTYFLEGESTVCNTYYAYYVDHIKDRDFFRKCEDYLMKVGEQSRREKGMFLWTLLFVLMIIESSAFGFALAPFAMSHSVTPNMAVGGGFALGTLLSIIGLAFSEFSGRDLYHNRMVGQVLSLQHTRERGSRGDLKQTSLVNLDKTYDDNDAPRYQQILNRLNVDYSASGIPKKNFTITVAYLVFIIGLAVAAFWVRSETLAAQEAELVGNPTAVMSAPAADDDFPMTPEMQAVQDKAEGHSAQDQIDAMHRASLVTYAVLSGLFIFIQLTSTYISFRFRFAGERSKEAWEHTHKHKNADEYVAHHKSKARSIAVDAQHSLSKLQGGLSATLHQSGRDNDAKEHNKELRTFERYAAIQESKAIVAKTDAAIKSMISRHLDDVSSAIERGDMEAARMCFKQVASVMTNTSGKQITPELTAQFKQYQSMFDAPAAQSVPAPVATAVQAPVHTPAPAVQVSNVVELPIAQAAPVVASPAPTEAAPAPAPAAFDPYAWGDLTLFEEDLDYIATKKGVEVDVLKRALRLQKFDKQDA